MLRNKSTSLGFSLAEIVIAIAVIGILGTTTIMFFNTSLRQYFALEQDGLAYGDFSLQSQRIGKVLRGLTDITEATNDDITVYAYFSPNDAYVSLIHYYKNAAKTQLMADVTPMSSNPPTGTPLTAQEKTYTIINNFYQAVGVNTFVYLDSAGNTLSMPIADLHTVKGIQVNLALPPSVASQSGGNSVSVTVSLRNRKTNL